jgi:hypothetical protein
MTPRPLPHNCEQIEETAVLETLTPPCTEQAVHFTEGSRDTIESCGRAVG